MELPKFCQSCSMPIDNVEMRGTEKNGSKSDEYCRYCYEQGAFVNPDMSINEMKVIVKTKLEEMHAPKNVVEKAINVLPELKRWKNKTTVA